jgi:hypothetical protein
MIFTKSFIIQQKDKFLKKKHFDFLEGPKSSMYCNKVSKMILMLDLPSQKMRLLIIRISKKIICRKLRTLIEADARKIFVCISNFL